MVGAAVLGGFWHSPEEVFTQPSRQSVSAHRPFGERTRPKKEGQFLWKGAPLAPVLAGQASGVQLEPDVPVGQTVEMQLSPTLRAPWTAQFRNEGKKEQENWTSGHVKEPMMGLFSMHVTPLREAPSAQVVFGGTTLLQYFPSAVYPERSPRHWMRCSIQ